MLRPGFDTAIPLLELPETYAP